MGKGFPGFEDSPMSPRCYGGLASRSVCLRYVLTLQPIAFSEIPSAEQWQYFALKHSRRVDLLKLGNDMPGRGDSGGGC